MILVRQEIGDVLRDVRLQKGRTLRQVASRASVALGYLSEVERDGTDWDITGDLTIKGVTKPVTLTVHFVGAGNNPMNKKLNFGFHATGTINRSDFGLGMAVPVVSDKVDLTINAAFQQR